MKKRKNIEIRNNCEYKRKNRRDQICNFLEAP